MLRSISKIMVVLASVAVMVTVANAGVKVVSDKNVDSYSVDTIIASIIKPGMSDQQKSEAIFEYLVTHIYHHNVAQEISQDGINGHKYAGSVNKVMDTVKMINVYGFAICGSSSWSVNELFNAAGLFGRINGVNGHTVPEVKYDGKWHYFDVDMMGYVKDKSGNVVGVDDIKNDKSLLFNNKNKYNFKYDGANGMWACLNAGVKYSMYGRKATAHSMNINLRDGESLTRWFKRQWAPAYRYYVPPFACEYTKRLASRYNVENGVPAGPSRDKTFYLYKEGNTARFGNWEMVYQPPLGKSSARDGIFKVDNIKQNKKAPFLVAKDPKAVSSIIYNFYYPYIVAGNPGDLANPADDKDGVIIEGKFASANGKVEYSFDLGRTWIELYSGGGEFKKDATTIFNGKYGWLLRLSFEGKGAGLESFKSYASGQLSPAALPFVDGKTKMTFERSGVATILYAPDVSEPEAVVKAQAESMLGVSEMNEAKATSHIVFEYKKPGHVVYRVDAPSEITRVQAAAGFAARKPDTMNGISFSIDNGATWIMACNQRVVKDEDHPEEYWGQAVDGILDFAKKKAYSNGCTPGGASVRENSFEPKPVKSVLVKFHADGGDSKLIKVMGIYVDYKVASKVPVKITHAWEGGEQSVSIPASLNTKSYAINGGPLASNLSIKMEAGGK